MENEQFEFTDEEFDEMVMGAPLVLFEVIIVDIVKAEIVAQDKIFAYDPMGAVISSTIKNALSMDHKKVIDYKYSVTEIMKVER